MDRTLAPNTTQFPNALTDQIMPLVSGNEWKVVHYGVRYALGHRSNDTLSIAQFARGRQAEDGAWVDRGTGLDEAEVKACLAFLCDEAHIFLREDRPRKPHGYRLNPDFSSINLDVLERRAQPQPAALPVESPAPEAPAPPSPRRSASASSLARYVEQPISNVMLDGSDRPVSEQLRAKLTTPEGYTFDYLASLAQKTGVGPAEDVAWVLFRLWRTYGFRRLQNAFQMPGAASLDDISKSCLVGVVTEMLEAEKFGPITQSLRDKIVNMTDEWPVWEDWQEAIRSAVLYNSHRLATVEKNLKRKATGSVAESPGAKDAGPTTPVQGRKRPARRQSEWNDEDLRAGRDADRGKEWTPPPE
jgi:hypothetical protein